MLSFRPIKQGTNNDKSLYLQSHSVSTPITALRKRIVLKCLPCSDEKGFRKILNSGCNYFSTSGGARFGLQSRSLGWAKARGCIGGSYGEFASLWLADACNTGLWLAEKTNPRPTTSKRLSHPILATLTLCNKINVFCSFAISGCGRIKLMWKSCSCLSARVLFVFVSSTLRSFCGWNLLWRRAIKACGASH